MNFSSLKFLFPPQGRMIYFVIVVLVIFGGLYFYAHRKSELAFHPDWTETDRRQMREIVNFLGEKNEEYVEQRKDSFRDWINDTSFSDFKEWPQRCMEAYDHGKQYFSQSEFSSINEVVVRTAKTGDASCIGEYDWSLLHLACALGKRELACHLMDKGADVNQRTMTDGPSSKVPGDAPINWLAGAGMDYEHPVDTETRLFLIEALASRGADLDVKVMDAIAPFEMCCVDSGRSVEDKEKLVLKLMDMGADLCSPVVPRIGKKRSPFRFPVQFGLCKAVRRMCEMGADVNAGYEGPPPLFFVKTTRYPERHLETARILLDHGACINAPIAASNKGEYGEGQTPLSVLCSTLRSLSWDDKVDSGSIEALFAFYLERGADVNQAAVNGWTPLMYLFSNIDMTKGQDLALTLARMFLEHGADPSLKNKEGKTVVDIIRLKGKEGEDVLKKLPELLSGKKMKHEETRK